MLSYLWTLCCEATIVDARTNNVSFINLVDQLNGPANATLIPIKLGVCTMWRRDDPSGQDDVEYHLAWESPAGDRLFELPARASVGPGPRNVRTIAEVAGLPLSGAGEYKMVIEVRQAEGDYTPVGHAPIEVVLG